MKRSVAQQPDQVDDEYIEKRFKALIGAQPKMGWFADPYGFIATDDAAEIALLAPLGMPSAGTRKQAISGGDAAQIRQLYGEACELGEADRLTSFNVAGAPERGRALYTTKRFNAPVRAGLVSIPLSGKEMAGINHVLAWPGRDVLRRDEAIGARIESFFYSIHKLYDVKTGLLKKEAIILHAKDGRILAHNLLRNIDTAPACDGCSIPEYSWELTGVYRPLNMFELPGFAYPVLLLDTSTVEGQALSLLTFAPNGKLAEFRLYEYVIHCR